MLQSFDPKPERFPNLRQAGILAFWGVLLAIGGCAGFFLTLNTRYISVTLGAVFCLGVLALLTSLLICIVAGVRDWIDYFRE